MPWHATPVRLGDAPVHFAVYPLGLVEALEVRRDLRLLLQRIVELAQPLDELDTLREAQARARADRMGPDVRYVGARASRPDRIGARVRRATRSVGQDGRADGAAECDWHSSL